MATEFRADTQVTLCLGPGGVGKTTISAAYAMAAAKQGHRAVVLTIDPARRLANALGFENSGLNHRLTKVEGDWPGEVWATMLDPAEMFTNVISAQATSPEQRDRILANRIFKNLLTSLSGTNEYMATERLYELFSLERFDHIIVDTPPAQHAFDFLDSPQRLTRFLDHQLYRTVFRPRKGVLRSLNVAAQRLLKILGGVVGSDLVNDVVDFFSDFDGIDAGFSERAHAIGQLLQSRQAKYVLVTSPKSEPLRESGWIAESLVRRERSVHAILANRSTPVALDEDTKRWAQNPRNLLEQNFAEMHIVAATERQGLNELIEKSAAKDSIVVEIPEQAQPVHDLDTLVVLANRLQAVESLWTPKPNP